MPRLFSVEKLPDEILKEVKSRLRAKRYLGQSDALKWLNKAGYEIKNSSINRYAIRLMESDKQNGVMVDSISGINQNVIDMFAELEAIRLRESEILNEIKLAAIELHNRCEKSSHVV